MKASQSLQNGGGAERCETLFYREGECKTHCSRFCHPKTRRRNIEPEKCKYCACKSRRERREINLILKIRDSSIRHESGAENSARESINTVYYAACVEAD